jgi:hypothetical protein
VGRVVRGEEDHIDLARKALEHRLFFKKRDHDIPGSGDRLPAHDGDVTRIDRRDHAVARDPDGKALAAAQPRGWHRDIIHDLFTGEDRRPGRDPVEKREVAYLFFRRQGIPG